MTRMQKRALAKVPLSKETVKSFYDGSRSGSAEQCLLALCESHERLRIEMEGLEIMLQGVEAKIAKLRASADAREEE